MNVQQMNLNDTEIGSSILRHCFLRYLNAKNQLERSEAELIQIMDRIEEVFFYLIDEFHRGGMNIDELLESPNSVGQTCFSIASDSSKKIAEFIIERDVKLNSIDTVMMTPSFKYQDLSLKMMQRGVNPNIVAYDGDSELDDHPSYFENDDIKKLLSKFSKSIYYSIEDIICYEHCPTDCASKLRKFYYKEGSFVTMTDNNRIGKGGFGMVFNLIFHGRQMAAKCVEIGKMKGQTLLKNVESDLEKNIAEYTMQLSTSGSGIILPTAILRQQNQQNMNGKRISLNYNIYIYPKYHCNLYEFHRNHHHEFTNEVLADILFQCYTRNSSN